MDSSTLYEIIGYVASGFIVLSLTMRSILKLRVIGLAGSIGFTVYGYLIGAWPIVMTNLVIVIIHLHFLRELLTADEYFQMLRVEGGSRYVDSFLEYYGDEIGSVFPEFAGGPDDEQLMLMALRNLVPAGLFAADIVDDKTLELRLDFAIPGYRDFKIGKHLYRDGYLRRLGYRTVVARSEREQTTSYLRKMGFEKDPDIGSGEWYSLALPESKTVPSRLTPGTEPV